MTSYKSCKLVNQNIPVKEIHQGSCCKMDIERATKTNTKAGTGIGFLSDPGEDAGICGAGIDLEVQWQCLMNIKKKTSGSVTKTE